MRFGLPESRSRESKAWHCGLRPPHIRHRLRRHGFADAVDSGGICNGNGTGATASPIIDRIFMTAFSLLRPLARINALAVVRKAPRTYKRRVPSRPPDSNPLALLSLHRGNCFGRAPSQPIRPQPIALQGPCCEDRFDMIGGPLVRTYHRLQKWISGLSANYGADVLEFDGVSQRQHGFRQRAGYALDAPPPGGAGCVKLPIKIEEGDYWPGEVRPSSHVRRAREP